MSFQIAIIDQGVDANHERLKGCLIDGVTITKTPDGYSFSKGIYRDDTGHGTGIAAIIHRMLPEAALFAVKLASEDRRITGGLLTEAIRLCIDIQQIRVINISMGIATNSPPESLSAICREAAEKGILISSAAYNFPNLSCYPAHFPSVYGVSTGLVKDQFEYGYKQGPINIFAKGTTQRVASLNNSFKISQGTSYATAHFSGIAGRVIYNNPDKPLPEINDIIRLHSKKDVRELYYFRNDVAMQVHSREKHEMDAAGKRLFTWEGKIGFSRKIALYPASEKEMRTLLEFDEACKMEISVLIDYPVRLSHANLGPGGCLQEKCVRDIDKIDFSGFDTLVCGYFLDQLSDANIAFGIRLLEKCISLNKHLILWDEDVYDLAKKLIEEKGYSYSACIYAVKVDNDLYKEIKEFHNLPHLKIPVIGITGTSNKQGKITAQLRIKNILQREGYNVSHVSTEPQGILFGADFLFPYGFKCPIEPPEHEWSRLLRIAMRGIQRYNKPDIIITGTQGGLLPRTRAISNEIGHDLSSLHFLLGVQPDVIACAINPTDTPELIRQTIEVIASYCKCKPLFCFMTPWTRKFLSNERTGTSVEHRSRLDQEELREKIREYEAMLTLPVIDIMDDSIDGFVLQTIQDAFS